MSNQAKTSPEAMAQAPTPEVIATPEQAAQTSDMQVAEANGAVQKENKTTGSKEAVDQPATPQMGAILLDKGVGFRVWAPNAEEVSVIGDFNRWNAQSNPLQPEGNGNWYGEVPEAKVGQGYRFRLQTATGEVTRIDPYARAVTN